jgi:hypothetical protein
MPVFDTSSIIYAWDNYPIQQFPGLWDWISERIKDSMVMMSSVALGEVRDNSPECWQWLRQADLQTHEINNAILQEALHIKKILGIVDDNYGGGVGGLCEIVWCTSGRLFSSKILDGLSFMLCGGRRGKAANPT